MIQVTQIGDYREDAEAILNAADIPRGNDLLTERVWLFSNSDALRTALAVGTLITGVCNQELEFYDVSNSVVSGKQVRNWELKGAAFLLLHALDDERRIKKETAADRVVSLTNGHLAAMKSPLILPL